MHILEQLLLFASLAVGVAGIRTVVSATLMQRRLK